MEEGEWDGLSEKSLMTNNPQDEKAMPRSPRLARWVALRSRREGGAHSGVCWALPITEEEVSKVATKVSARPIDGGGFWSISQSKSSASRMEDSRKSQIGRISMELQVEVLWF